MAPWDRIGDQLSCAGFPRRLPPFAVIDATMSTPAAVPVPLAPPLSFPARVIGILTSPRATFERIVAHPSWLAPLLLMVLVIGGANFAFLSTQVGQAAMLEQQVSTMQSFGAQVSDQQYEAMRAQAAYSPYIQLASIVVISPVMLVIVAGILHGIFSGILGGGATFKQSLAVVAHAGMVNLVQVVFTTPLNYARGSMSSATNLAVFFPFLAEGSFLANFLGTIDLFVVWWLLVLAIGLSVLFRRTTASIMIGLGGVYFIIALAIAAIKAAWGHA